MINSTNIIEIFSSIQGEGPYVGCRQIFVRFAGCNLSCDYCDTPFQSQEYCNSEAVSGSQNFKKIKNPVSVEQLFEEIACLTKNNSISHHSISLTGGEPLLNTEFLSEFLPAFKKKYPEVKVYLETNGTLFSDLEKIIENTDIISMDLKLKSSTGVEFPFEKHKKFIEVSGKYNKELFAKVVITGKISDEEIMEVSELIKSFDKEILLILQPVSSADKNILLSAKKIIEIQEKFLEQLKDVRVIPQTHKFLNLL